jgi:general secretion pathway protein G
LVITVAIVGVLALGLVPLGELAVRRAKEHELRDALRDIRTAIDAYKQASDEGRIERKADASGYPPNLEVLAKGVKDARMPEDKQIYFLRRIPRDPFFPDPEVRPERTWGLRSYESPPEEPREGNDLFDVYSKSDQTGLNGVPYRQW